MVENSGVGGLWPTNFCKSKCGPSTYWPKCHQCQKQALKSTAASHCCDKWCLTTLILAWYVLMHFCENLLEELLRIIIIIIINENLHNTVTKWRPKSGVLKTTVTCQWGSEDDDKNMLRWWKGEFTAMMKLGDEYECSRKWSSKRKCFHNIDLSMKGRRRGCYGSTRWKSKFFMWHNHAVNS